MAVGRAPAGVWARAVQEGRVKVRVVDRVKEEDSVRAVDKDKVRVKVRAVDKDKVRAVDKDKVRVKVRAVDKDKVRAVESGGRINLRHIILA